MANSVHDEDKRLVSAVITETTAHVVHRTALNFALGCGAIFVAANLLIRGDDVMSAFVLLAWGPMTLALGYATYGVALRYLAKRRARQQPLWERRRLDIILSDLAKKE